MSYQLSKVRSVALEGLTTREVHVEVSVQRGLPAVHVVGLPDASVREATERVRGALTAAGCPFPRGRVTISLSPAELRKVGSSFDVPIALALLQTQGSVGTITSDTGFIGELGLDGSIRSVRGVLPLALGLVSLGVRHCYVAVDDYPLVARVPNLQVVPVSTLSELIDVLRGSRERRRPALPPPRAEHLSDSLDDLVGLPIAKRALLIAAAGGHHLLMLGPPGTGKTALARCLAGLLPPLTPRAQLEVNALWSLSGLARTWQVRPPWRAPHHSASAPSLLGGGPQVQPGDASLAHHGVLFLDELAEFRRDALEQLREPLEEGVVRLARAQQRITYPAQFQLICASNPCPCGYLGDPVKACTCSPAVRERYARRLSGPLLDRIDLSVWVPRESLVDKALTHRTATPRAQQDAKGQLEIAWRRQRQRHVVRNTDLSSKDVRVLVPLDATARMLLRRAETKLGLSPRGLVRTLKVARTIADLADQDRVSSDHIAEALQFRLSGMQSS